MMTKKLAIIAISLAILLLPRGVRAQSYTLSPPPFLLAQTNAGAIINNACVWTYIAGTTTAAATYSDNAGTANSNPIRSDSAGRFTAYLLAGSNYKFVYETACTPPAHGTVLRTADNVAGVPSSASTVDVQGTAGETLSAGQAVYLSDGSGSKNAAQWYKADNALGYSSVLPTVGMATAAITSGVVGTIRLQGQVTGLTSLTPGSTYYVGTAGALTLTQQGRKLGVADSTTTFVLTPNPVPIGAWVNDFRLTLTTALPVTTANVTAATTIYCTPMTGNRIDLPDAVGNPVRVTSAEFSIAVPATTATMYDIFVYNNAGVATLELLAWTNDTTRATAIIRTTTGRYYKTGDLTRMYVGSFRTTGVSGQTEDSLTSRFLWNYYNRVTRALLVQEATASWTYTTATWRQANGAAGDQVAFIVGVAEDAISLTLNGIAGNSSADVFFANSIGLDTVTAPTATAVGGVGMSTTGGGAGTLSCTLNTIPTVGYHYAAWLEVSQAGTGTTTFYGIPSGLAAYLTTKSGLAGIWKS